MFRLSEMKIVNSQKELAEIPEGKVLINTINAHSYNTAQKDEAFSTALDTSYLNVNVNVNDNVNGNDNGNGNCRKYLIPDGVAIVKACKWLKAKSQPKERIAGWDLFSFEMERLEGRSKKENVRCKRVMFMGSSERVQ